MSTPIIIAICVLLLVAYIFDITAPKTKIPSVILMLVVGWLVQQVTYGLGIALPKMDIILQLLGTVGLILIVLEGAFDLELDPTKLPIIGRATIISFLPMLLFSFCLAWTFKVSGGVSFKTGLINAIPFAVISSAIAIPSVQNLCAADKEFITYESSLSDIFGVIMFNFIIRNEQINIKAFAHFFSNIFIILIITFVATLGLTFLISRIKHHVKFVPIIILLVLIYSASKIYHLPALIFIMLFGLFLGNIDMVKSNKFIKKLKPEAFKIEVNRLKELTGEVTFLVRASFFLLFGFFIQTKELLNINSLGWAFGIVAGLFTVRFASMKIFKYKSLPLFFVIPRGLITILLFLYVPHSEHIPFVNKSLIIQVIILSTLIMMFGLMFTTKTNKSIVQSE